MESEVVDGNGVEVRAGGRVVLLDPRRHPAGAPAVVTHGHLDHLTGGAYMTRPTKDFLFTRRGRTDGATLDLGRPLPLDGLEVVLHDAGHVLGAAMVEVRHAGGTVLYTGDFNLHGGLTCGRAEPREADVLVLDATYGDPRYDLPPKAAVLATMETWIRRRLGEGPVALCGYRLGRAQELIALLNRAGAEPLVERGIGDVSRVYVRHGAALRFRDLAEGFPGDVGPGTAFVVPNAWLKRGAPFAEALKAARGAGAYASGWCHDRSFFASHEIERQFALSDHAGFADLLSFAAACRAKEVVTVFGHAEVLAGEISKRLGVHAHPLAHGRAAHR